MKKLYALFFFAFLAAGLMAQTPEPIKFNESTHEFGVLNQNDKAETVFKFTNESKEPVKLHSVKASCGCTTPKWSQEAIAPGKTGEITVSYNTNRIGPFHKSVTVVYDTTANPITLFIKGEVKATEAAPVDGHEHTEGDGHNHGTGESAIVAPPLPVKPAAPTVNYTIPRGALTFEKMIENMREVTSDGSQTVDFRFKNTSDKVVKFTDQKENDPGVTVKLSVKELKPGQEAIATVTVDGKLLKEAKQEDGFFSKKVAFFTDEALDNRKQLTINGSYKRVYTAEELANAPKVQFETVDVNGGKIIEGEDFVYEYRFKNTGKGNLEIYSAKASCGCTATEPSKSLLAPGEEATITATFHSQGRLGQQTKTITVKSNDPSQSSVVLKFTVEVVKDPFHAGGMMGGQ